MKKLMNSDRVEKRYPYIKVGRVLVVDVNNSYLITGKAFDRNNQIRFNVSPSTIILNRRGRRISLSLIRPGQIVRVEHAPNMTFSIPPQTQAYRIQVL